ncbi:replication protein [Paenibacillus dakarensis]|uniref:replication protein n=1 Tax=Paenibacillus dakarensis TaxID=1527293 RepID=UPI0006D52AC0|nr:replication protein [Paenibacillus dakarensis]
MSHLDEPYTRITNEILEEIAQRPFNGTQYRIIICILRNTYGFQRKSHELSLSFISEAIGSTRNQVKKELDKLINMKVIKVYSEGSYTTSRHIGFNKYFSEWQLEGCTAIRVQSPKKSTVPQMEDGVDCNRSTGGVLQLQSQERKVFKESIKEISSSTDVNEQMVMDAFTKIFGPLIMPSVFRDYVKKLRASGQSDEMIVELFYEAGESSTKPNLRFLEVIGQRWVENGITSREQAKALKNAQRLQQNTVPFNKYRKQDKPIIPMAVGETHGPGPSDEEYEEMIRAAEEMAATKKER